MKEKKLHLGCGERYLDGYVNIDFPQTEHTLQEKSVADEYADILKMDYPKGVFEIRLHHVLEHFSHVGACVLLTKWQGSLTEDGVLHIEVPDFGASMIDLLCPFLSFKKKCAIERHVFGSHEASWAVHHVGYTRRSLKYMLNLFGFKIREVQRSKWKDIRNITIIAKKEKEYDKTQCKSIAQHYLGNFLVDESESEEKLLDIWMSQYSTFF